MSAPLDSSADIAVVGASLAGLRAAEELRHLGHRGRITVVGEEAHPPYDRPPLSKQFLAGKWDEARIHHHAPEKLDTLGIEFRLGTRAMGLDTEGRMLELDDGTDLRYDGLIVATGCKARWLPGTQGMDGVFVLRTIDDAIGLRQRLTGAGAGARVVVIGAGFIGAEVAATCHGIGADVAIVEALETPLAHVLGAEMGAACAGLHSDNGVALHVGVGVERIGPGSAAPLAVLLDDGRELPADAVVVGVGVVPATDWLEGSALSLDNGVVCDAGLFAADRVVAAGDVARWPHQGLDQSVRIEHWTNAAESGPSAARNLLAGSDEAVAYSPVPFFWSDQYASKIQMLGRPDPDDEVVLIDGSVEERKLVALYKRGTKLAAVLAISRAARLMAYRPLLEAGASFDDAMAVG